MNDGTRKPIKKDDSLMIQKINCNVTTTQTLTSKIEYILFFFMWLLPFTVCSQQIDQNGSDPFEVSVSYTGDLFGNVTGGNETGIRYFDNIDVNMQVNFDQLPLGLSGSSLVISGSA